MTLRDFLSQVHKANPALVAAHARAQALEHRVSPVSTLDDPFIAAGIDEVPFGGGGNSVIRYQLSQTVPFPGKLGARGSAVRGRADAALADVETARRTLTVVATQAFYRAYFNERVLVLNEETRRYIRETIESTKARYKTGGASHHEWLQGRIELSVLEVERLRLMRERKTLHALLNEMRNQPPGTPIEIGEHGFDRKEEPEVDAEKLLAHQPELRSMQKTVDAAGADETVARFSYAPDFVIQGMAMQPRSGGMGQASNWGVMAGINLPVFFWRKQSEQVSAARADREAAEAERKGMENRLKTEIIDAMEQLKTAHDVVALYKRDVIPMTEIAARNARSGYAARRLPLTQLLDTLKVARIQRLEFLAAEIDVALAVTRIENLLASPPLMRLSPARPTVFGGAVTMGAMSEGMTAGTSGTVNMGSGLSGPTRRESKPGSDQAGSAGMGTMQ